MALSQRFRHTLRDILEKAALAIVLSASAVVLHLIDKACEAARLPAWILLVLDVVFGFILLADALTIICVAVVLIVRLPVDTFRELRAFIKES
jgi:hypothetical protein